MNRLELILQSEMWRRWGRIGRIVVTGLCAVLAAAMAAGLLYGAYYGYLHFSCGTSGDYARYTNMMWNTAHGHPFVYGLTRSYLKVHLSFTLGLLGYLFWIWNHPFFLMFLQWLSLVMGAVLLWSAAARLKIPHRYTAAVILFWTAYHFTQLTVLCEFHGTSLYYILIPFIYYAAVFRKGLVGLSLVLLLGLREEAGMMAIPLLLYAARKDSWRWGYVYAAVAMAYVALAVFVLFPMANGVDLAERRKAEMGIVIGATSPSFWPDMVTRLCSMGWILLPVAPLLLRGWRPLLVIPSAAVVITMASTYEHQIELGIHYSAVITACMGVAMIEAGRRLYATESSRLALTLRAVFPLYVLIVVGISHFQKGPLAHGYHEKHWKDRYQGENQDGLHSLWVARHRVPGEGVLLTERTLAGFVANRQDLLRQALSMKPPLPPEADVVFCRLSSMPSDCKAGLKTNSWGVRYFDEGYVVLQKGYDTAGNAECLRIAEAIAVVRPAFTFGKRFRDTLVPGEGLVRYWRGHPSKRPMLSTAGPISLEDGDYRIQLRFRSGKPGGAPGRIRVLDEASNAPLVEAEISVSASDTKGFREQSVPFRVHGAKKILVTIEGGAVPLWLRRIVFERAVSAP